MAKISLKYHAHMQLRRRLRPVEAPAGTAFAKTCCGFDGQFHAVPRSTGNIRQPKSGFVVIAVEPPMERR
jgi:hypothetical protein